MSRTYRMKKTKPPNGFGLWRLLKRMYGKGWWRHEDSELPVDDKTTKFSLALFRRDRNPV